MSVILGASETPAAMGCDLHGGTPWQTWARKLGIIEDTETDTEAMKWGRLIEPVLLREFIGTELRRDRYAASPETRRSVGSLRATPDAVLDMEDGSFAIVEAKCLRTPPPAEPLVPWVIQTLAQRRVYPEVSRVYLVAFGALSVSWWLIPKHQRALDRVAREQDRFLEMVEKEIPPPVRAEDAAVISKRWPFVKPYIAQLPPEAEQWDREYVQGAALIAQGKEMQDIAKARLEAQIKDAEEAVIIKDDRLVARYTWRPHPVKEYTVPAQTKRPLRRLGSKGEPNA